MSEANNILEELESMNSPLAHMNRHMQFNLPEGYFEQLPAEIMMLKNESDFKAKFSHYNSPLQVPSGYFEALPGKLLTAVSNEAIATERSAGGKGKRIFFAPQAKWASAAAIALIISLGGYLMFSGNIETQPEKMLSSIPGNEIKEYVQHSYDLDPGNINNNNLAQLNVENTDIILYLNETGWE